jgi:RHS repeat-associated protein
MVPGDYYLGALADYSGLEVEADESNNGVGIPFKVALSDMIMTAVGSTATKAAPGSSINVSDTLKNQGSVTSTVTVRVGYYLSSDNVIAADDTFLGYRSVGALAAGAAQTNVGANYATVPVGTAPGTYYIGAIADYSALEAESDETNNSLVGPTIAIGPDLVMSSFSTTSTAAIPGYVVPITDTLKNQGASATTSGCRTVAYYLSTDDIITATDTLIGSRQHCGALAANGTSVNAASILIIPANTAIGTYYLGAIADSTEAEAEAVETNNSIVVAVPLLVANVPAAPTGVNATGAHTKATVSFNASGNDGGAAITGYTVTSNPAGGVDSNAGSTGLSHVVTGLTNGTSYTFTVKAINAVGSSVASQPSNSITPAPTAPDAPTNATAVGGHTKATVSFTAPAENGAAISGYNVSSSPAGGVDSNAGGTGLSHIVTGLTNGVSYTFTVTAINAMGTSTPSQPSNSIIPAPTAPDAPTHVKAAGGNSQATISFTAPAENGSPISGYTVTSNPGGITASGTGSPIIVTGLTNGTAYTFTVTATNGIGTSDPSQPSNSIIAMVVPQVYYIHADHLSSPRQITDAAGNLVWQWDNSDPFGNNVPNENPNGAGQFNFNLRFPGQYADKETNTYYNVMRDYDPSTGRYIQSDPIGLDGGINTYTYALNDPTYWTDPLGLESISKRQAKRIIDEAATWVDTAYASPGATKNEGADCSGSTWAIYKKAGFPFKRSSTASFENLNVKTGRFVKVDKPQIGDIVLFKKHMAVYDSNAGTTCGCSKRNNLDLWTTHGTNDDPGRYGAGAQRDFPGTPKYYRYNTDDSGIRFPLLEWGII